MLCTANECQAESSLVTGEFKMKGDQETHRSLEWIMSRFIASFWAGSWKS